MAACKNRRARLCHAMHAVFYDFLLIYRFKFLHRQFHFWCNFDIKKTFTKDDEFLHEEQYTI